MLVEGCGSLQRRVEGRRCRRMEWQLDRIAARVARSHYFEVGVRSERRPLTLVAVKRGVPHGFRGPVFACPFISNPRRDDTNWCVLPVYLYGYIYIYMYVYMRACVCVCVSVCVQSARLLVSLPPAKYVYMYVCDCRDLRNSPIRG